MFTRFLKVFLFLPFGVFLMLYYLFSPLWYILWDQSTISTTERIEKFFDCYERWK